MICAMPDAAISIFFGTFLMGRGQTWIDDVQLEAVGQEVALTAATEEPITTNAQPTNLDFEVGLEGWSPESTSQNYTTDIDTLNVHGGKPAVIFSRSKPILV
jgi:hypothetical protein